MGVMDFGILIFWFGGTYMPAFLSEQPQPSQQQVTVNGITERGMSRRCKQKKSLDHSRVKSIKDYQCQGGCIERFCTTRATRQLPRKVLVRQAIATPLSLMPRIAADSFTTTRGFLKFCWRFARNLAQSRVSPSPQGLRLLHASSAENKLLVPKSWLWLPGQGGIACDKTGGSLAAKRPAGTSRRRPSFHESSGATVGKRRQCVD